MQQPVRIIDWDFDAHTRVTANDRVIHIVVAFNVANDVKGVGVLQTVQELAAFTVPVRVKNHGVNLTNVGINAEAEKHHLQQRDNQRKEERPKIAPDMQNLFEKNRAKAAKSVKHAKPPTALAVCRSALRTRPRGSVRAVESPPRQ